MLILCDGWDRDISTYETFCLDDNTSCISNQISEDDGNEFPRSMEGALTKPTEAERASASSITSFWVIIARPVSKTAIFSLRHLLHARLLVLLPSRPQYFVP